MTLTRNCEECGHFLDREDHFETTVKEDHVPKEPHIPPERITIQTYNCPECGHCPVEED